MYIVEIFTKAKLLPHEIHIKLVQLQVEANLIPHVQLDERKLLHRPQLIATHDVSYEY